MVMSQVFGDCVKSMYVSTAAHLIVASPSDAEASITQVSIQDFDDCF